MHSCLVGSSCFFYSFSKFLTLRVITIKKWSNIWWCHCFWHMVFVFGTFCVIWAVRLRCMICLRKLCHSVNSNTLSTLLHTFFREEWPLCSLSVNLELCFRILNREGRKYIWFLKLMCYVLSTLQFIMFLLKSVLLCCVLLKSLVPFNKVSFETYTEICWEECLCNPACSP